MLGGNLGSLLYGDVSMMVSVIFQLNNQPMQPTAPPRYDVLFQVNGGYTGDHTS